MFKICLFKRSSFKLPNVKTVSQTLLRFADEVSLIKSSMTEADYVCNFVLVLFMLLLSAVVLILH